MQCEALFRQYCQEVTCSSGSWCCTLLQASYDDQKLIEHRLKVGSLTGYHYWETQVTFRIGSQLDALAAKRRPLGIMPSKVFYTSDPPDLGTLYPALNKIICTNEMRKRSTSFNASKSRIFALDHDTSTTLKKIQTQRKYHNWTIGGDSLTACDTSSRTRVLISGRTNYIVFTSVTPSDANRYQKKKAALNYSMKSSLNASNDYYFAKSCYTSPFA